MNSTVRLVRTPTPCSTISSVKLVGRQKALLGIKRKMACIVVREIERPIAVADDEQLQKTHDGFCIAIPRVVLVFDDLLHGATRAYAESLQFDLNDRHPVDQENDVIAMMAVVRVDTELVDHLEGILAPVPDVDERGARCAWRRRG